MIQRLKQPLTWLTPLRGKPFKRHGGHNLRPLMVNGVHYFGIVDAKTRLRCASKKLYRMLKKGEAHYI